MSAFSTAQLRILARARKRPICFKFGKLPNALIHQLIHYHHQHCHKNILDKAIKSRMDRNLPMENSAYLNENYKQIALQSLKSGGMPANQLAYANPLSPDLVNGIEAVTGPGYRMRLSALQTGAHIPEHVDDPNQLRALALLQGRQIFVLRMKSDEVELNMQLGEVWYINTAWPHRVVNLGEQTRLALLIDLADHDFEKIIAKATL